MTKINLEGIAVTAARECVRQQVGLDRLVKLLTAYEYVTQWPDPSEGMTEYHLKVLAVVIEPKARSLHSDLAEYRQTPVTFLDGGDSANPQLIPERITDLVREIPMIVKYNREHGPRHGDALIKSWIKEFLWVHPFTDGNGRTAWVLYNWLRGTMATPAPLPDLFGAGYLDSTVQPPIGF